MLEMNAMRSPPGSRWTRVLLCASALAGCAAQAESDGATETVAIAADSTVSPSANVMPRRTEIATLQFSDTHSIHFYEYDELGLGLAQETFHVDRDAAARTHLLKRLPADITKLSDMYDYLAKDRGNADVRLSLAAADTRIDEMRQLTAEFETELAKTSREIIEDPSIDAPGIALPRGGEPLVQGSLGHARSALCAEPAWNWDADHRWFHEHHCFRFLTITFDAPGHFWTELGYCASQAAHLQSPGQEGSAFDAVGFAQSHCSPATFNTYFRSKRSCGFLGMSTCISQRLLQSDVIQPRFLSSQRWTGKSTYVASIHSAEGNFAGLAAWAR
jgi:hypothetical protein